MIEIIRNLDVIKLLLSLWGITTPQLVETAFIKSISNNTVEIQKNGNIIWVFVSRRTTDFYCLIYFICFPILSNCLLKKCLFRIHYHLQLVFRNCSYNGVLCIFESKNFHCITDYVDWESKMHKDSRFLSKNQLYHSILKLIFDIRSGIIK